jgi:acetyl esterase/lipase
MSAGHFSSLLGGDVRMDRSEGVYEVEVVDTTYLIHESGPLSVRVHKPKGTGPFPAVIDAHGGGWCVGSNRNNDSINRSLAARGIVVASLDFRMPPVAAYPAAVADINFGVRWLKQNAETYQSRADLVGAIGSSSGGHMIVLSAMTPADPRYSAIQRADVSEDAEVPFAVALWPVICPKGRYDYLHTIPPSNAHAVFFEGIQRHEAFWGSSEAMIEGSPVRALARGDQVLLPRILYVQNETDALHPRTDMEKFLSGYTRTGGSVRQEMYQGDSYDFIRVSPESPEGKRVLALVADFIWDAARAQSSSNNP